MKLSHLKTRIEGTLGANVVTLSSLLTCVNNCISAIHSKEYREFEDEDVVITDATFPIEHTLPAETRKIVFVKAKVNGQWYECDRLALSHAGMRIIANGVYYYVKKGKLYLDAGNPKAITNVNIGYYKNIPKVSMDTAEEALADTEIKIREALEDAFVFYGLAFFAIRLKYKDETIKEFSNTFKYFMEDMLNQLDEEDHYLTDETIVVDNRF